MSQFICVLGVSLFVGPVVGNDAYIFAAEFSYILCVSIFGRMVSGSCDRTHGRIWLLVQAKGLLLVSGLLLVLHVAIRCHAAKAWFSEHHV